MKIDNNNVGGLTADSTSASSRTGTNPAASREQGPGGGPGSDQVSLSSLGQKIQELSAAGEAERDKRIGQLSAAVEKGQYRVDAGQVTSKLIDEALALSKLPGTE